MLSTTLLLLHHDIEYHYYCKNKDFAAFSVSAVSIQGLLYENTDQTVPALIHQQLDQSLYLGGKTIKLRLIMSVIINVLMINKAVNICSFGFSCLPYLLYAHLYYFYNGLSIYRTLTLNPWNQYKDTEACLGP